MLTLCAKSSRLFPYLTISRFSTSEELAFLATPNNCYDLIMVLDGEVGLTTARSNVQLRSAVLVGMSPDCMRFSFARSTVGLHFRLGPHQLRHFVEETPLRALAQCPVEIGDVWGSRTAHLCEKVAAVGGLEAQVRVVEDFLVGLHRTCDTRASRYVTALAETDSADFSVKKLQQSLDLSERQLQRFFAEQVGTSPQAYAKIRRFQRVVARYVQQRQAATLSLLPLALEEGYYDQAHFIRDCKQLTGRTPTTYFANMDAHLSGSYNT